MLRFGLGGGVGGGGGRRSRKSRAYLWRKALATPLLKLEKTTGV